MVSIFEYDKEWEEKKLRKAEYEAGRSEGIELAKVKVLKSVKVKALRLAKAKALKSAEIKPWQNLYAI